MALAKDYKSVMGRSNDIMKKALGLDYDEFEKGGTVFDYDALMKICKTWLRCKNPG